MAWVPIIAWIVAGVVALVVLGFCAYEIVWKTNRLRRDLARLQEDAGRLSELQGALAGVRERLAAAGLQ